MKINWKVLAIATVAAGSTFAVPATMLEAQGRSNQAPAKAKKADASSADRARADQRARDDQRAREGQRNRDIIPIAQNNKKNGPPFCRSGAGHPVHGRSWCVSKGYGMGNDNWGRAGTWGDIIFGRNDRDRDRDRNRSGAVSSGTIADILGSVVFGRLQNQAALLGGGPISGRWLSSPSGPVVLQLQAGSRPLAELVDANRDGRTDRIYVNLGR